MTPMTPAATSPRCAATPAGASRLERYRRWDATDDEADAAVGYVPVDTRGAKRPGCTRVAWAELVSPLARHLAAHAGRVVPSVADEDHSRELVAVARVISHRYDREVRPGAGSHYWWAGRLVNVLLARLDDDGTTDAEARHDHRARHRRCRRKKLLRYEDQLAAYTPSIGKIPAQRWAKKIIDRGLELVRGNHAVGYYLPTWVDAISIRPRRKIGVRLDPFIRINAAPVWLKGRLGAISPHAAVGTDVPEVHDRLAIERSAARRPSNANDVVPG